MFNKKRPYLHREKNCLNQTADKNYGMFEMWEVGRY